MRIFRHTRPGREQPLDEAGEELRRTVTSVVFYDDVDVDADVTVRLDRRAQLRRIVAEAVVLQDKAVEVLADIRDREPMNEVWIAWLPPAGAPARACVQSNMADPKVLVEIMVTACK